MANTMLFVKPINTEESVLNGNYGLYIHLHQLPLNIQKRLSNEAKSNKIERSEYSYGYATQNFFHIELDLSLLSTDDIEKLRQYVETYRKVKNSDSIISRVDKDNNPFCNKENVLYLPLKFDDLYIHNWKNNSLSDWNSRIIVNWNQAVRRWLDNN
jgi:hypothetical protein